MVTSLRYDQPISHQLDVSYVSEVMEGWPDQAGASFFTLGAPVSPAMPYMLVLTPQLLSLADGFDMVQTELDKLVEKGWYALFGKPPFMPGNFCSKGCTRGNARDRWCP